MRAVRLGALMCPPLSPCDDHGSVTCIYNVDAQRSTRAGATWLELIQIAIHILSIDQNE